jgi:L-ascorbate metabolism protein UlaG (beta-lactamase superfamily)
MKMKEKSKKGFRMILIGSLIGITTIIFGIVMFVSCAATFGGNPNQARLEKMKQSKNFKIGKFHNIMNTPMGMQNGSIFKTMKGFFLGGENRVPEVSIPFIKVDSLELNYRNTEEVKVTWLGHSSVLISFEGYIFLTDPMFGKRASPVSFMGPKRFNDVLPLSLEGVEKIDAIIISHDHFDHLDFKTIKKLHSKAGIFFVPLGVGAHLEEWGVHPEKIVELDWWEESMFHPDIKFVSTPARHFSGRGLNDRNETLWTSWVIKSRRHTIYFGGDSGYSTSFKEIGEKYGPFDLTMLECGAYNKAWPYIHMMPEETAQANFDLRGKVLLPIHWGQFNLSLHPWTEPIERLLKKAESEKITVTTPKIGEGFVLNHSLPSTDWWRFQN